MEFNYSNKNIIVAPLDWGLGHAARCVPLIIELQKKNKVTVAVTPSIKKFILAELPTTTTVDVCSYNISYSKTLPVWLKILMQYFKIKKTIKQENKELEKLIAQHKFDLIISDNRFGFRNKDVTSIIITHQLTIQSPLFKNIATKINCDYLNQFDNVWVLDNETENLAGTISKGNLWLTKKHYLGPLSRLLPINKQTQKTIDVLILLSGVEPQRSILEKKLIEKFSNSNLSVVLVRGSETHFQSAKNITSYNLITTNELNELIEKSKTIICRSGYSTLMDLHAAKFDLSNLILIPTPGQTEQEYLGQHWKTKFGCKLFNQKEIEGIETLF